MKNMNCPKYFRAVGALLPILGALSGLLGCGDDKLDHKEVVIQQPKDSQINCAKSQPKAEKKAQLMVQKGVR